MDFYKLFSKIELLDSPEQRALIPGIDLSRADLITAGELILQNFLNELSIPKMLISSYSLREGIIIDTFEKLSINNRNFKI
jgi:exopolyphosphatase/pppGpp-phosphohydrolase